MAGKKRKQFSNAQIVALTTQVGSICPLCATPLFYKKKGINYSAFEIAHIYPLNPTKGEVTLLRQEEGLGGGDINDDDNLIPLCESCHGKFDKPRTVSEYRELLKIKTRLIERSGQAALWSQYPIEDSIAHIIDKLYSQAPNAQGADIKYDPKSVDDKVDGTMTRLTVRKIQSNVSYYYPWIRKLFANLDKGAPGTSDNISIQIKAYYIKQKQLTSSQQVVFENIVNWINAKTQPQSGDAAEILASFFIQNCEVLE